MKISENEKQPVNWGELKKAVKFPQFSDENCALFGEISFLMIWQEDEYQLQICQCSVQQPALRSESMEIADRIIRICAVPVCFESILQKLFSDYGLTMTYEQYVLVGSTVRSCLSWLKNTGKLSAEFEDNLML